MNVFGPSGVGDAEGQVRAVGCVLDRQGACVGGGDVAGDGQAQSGSARVAGPGLVVGGFTAKITLERSPSMHVAYDDDLVLKWKNGASTMGRAYSPSIATLLGGDPLDRTWHARLHGTPTAGPGVTLRLVGGGTC